MFPFWSSFTKRPELTINSKHVSVSPEVTEAVNTLRYRTVYKYSAERKTCG